jgi:ribonuclease HI
MSLEVMQIDFFTDGACPGNGQRPEGGRMGAGIVGRAGKVEREWAVPLGLGTNQKAELLAVREALLQVKDRAHTIVRIHTDSAYAIGCLTKGWNVKANKELVDEVRRLAGECARFQMVKVAGHAGVPANERADELAVRAALTQEHYSGS